MYIILVVTRMHLSFTYMQHEEVSVLETLLAIVVILFAVGYVFEKASSFIKQLKSGSAKLANGFEAKLSITPIGNRKSEECATNTNSTNVTVE